MIYCAFMGSLLHKVPYNIKVKLTILFIRYNYVYKDHKLLKSFNHKNHIVYSIIINKY